MRVQALIGFVACLSCHLFGPGGLGAGVPGDDKPNACVDDKVCAACGNSDSTRGNCADRKDVNFAGVAMVIAMMNRSMK